MIQEGQIVLFSFPQTDQNPGKLRPALVLRHLPGPHDDWLICLISSQLRHHIPGVDEIVYDTDPDFAETGLKLSSVIRITRLAVVSVDILQGTTGSLAPPRLALIRHRLSNWILSNSEQAEGKQDQKPEQPAQPDA